MTYMIRIEARELNPSYSPKRHPYDTSPEEPQFTVERVCDVELTAYEYHQVRRAIIESFTATGPRE